MLFWGGAKFYMIMNKVFGNCPNWDNYLFAAVINQTTQLFSIETIKV